MQVPFCCLCSFPSICVDVQVSFPYEHFSQDDFSRFWTRADSVMSKGCSLGKLISILGPDYALLSWSYDKDAQAASTADWLHFAGSKWRFLDRG